MTSEIAGSTALKLYESNDVMGSLILGATDKLKFIEDTGRWIAKSGMLGVTTDQRGATMVMIAASEKRTLLSVYREFHFMNDGKITQRADWMLAKFNELGGDHEQVQRDADAAEVKLTWKGRTSTFRFTWREAQDEPFVYAKDGKTFKDNWATPRARMQMLWARTVSDAVRAVCPIVCAGLYTPEDFGELETGGTDNGRIHVTQPAADDESTGTAKRGRPAGSKNKPKDESKQPDVIDAEVEPRNKEASDEIQREGEQERAQSEANARTLLLMEIEDAASKIGMTMAAINESVKKKAEAPESASPNVKSVDDMDDDRLHSLLGNLQKALAKKEASQQG
jgi:hypothetical protein